VANQVKIAHGTPAAPLTVAVVPQSIGGQNPSLAVAADGSTLVLPFYDSTNHQLAVAVPVTGGLALGVPSPTALPPPTAPSGPPCSPTSSSTDLQITAPTGAAATGFDPTCLAVIPDTAFTVTFNDQDATAPHNWELFKDPAYTTRVGGASGPSDIVSGPATQQYPVDALAAGIYYFRCDVHPTTMLGQLVVAKAGPQPGPSATPSS
jgi:plastocyanin